MTVTEAAVGKRIKEKAPVWPRMKMAFVLFPFHVLDLFFPKRKSYVEVVNSEWNDLEPLATNQHIIERKLIGETASEGGTHIYQLRAANPQLHNLLTGKIFGDFHFITNRGVFLRQFHSTTVLDISYLVFIDSLHYKFHALKKISSKEKKWKHEVVNQNDFDIIIECTDNYLRKLMIRN